ncbi:MAG: translocation/assembly module TamB domain-containing protein [Bacteroidia bacterium]
MQGQLLGRFRDVPGPRMVVDVEGSLESLQLMNKDVHDIELELALTQSSAKGQWKCRDPFLTHEAWLQVEDMLDLPTWSLSANLLACDLQALGWDSLPSILSTQLEIEGKSFDIDAFEGQVLVRNLDWLHNGSALHVNRQKLSRPRALAWNLEGDAIQGKIRGRFQPSQSQALIQAWLHDAVPQRFAAPIHSPSDSFEASFAVLQTDWLEHFVFPGAQMDPFEWSLSVRPGNQFALKTGAIHLEWAGFQMEGVQVEAQRSATESWTLSLASKYMRVGRTEYDDWGLQMTAQDQVWRTHAWVHDLKNRYAVNAHLRTRVTPEFISTRVDSSHLRLYDKQWVMDTSARIRIERSGALDIRRLALSDGEHYFELKGRIGAELSDTAVVEFYNLTPEILEPFLAEHVLDSLDGHAMGKIKGIALLGRAKLSADVSVNDVRWNQHDYGNLGLKVVQHKTHEMLSINVDSESGPLKGIELYGGVDISGYAQDEYNWDLYAELPKTTPVQVLQPLFQGVLTLETGYLSGFLHSYSLQGEAQIEGQVRAKNLGAKVDYLGTRYYTTADFEIDNRGISSARPFRVTDESRLNYAWGSLKLQHQDYDNLRLDLRLDSARNLKVLNTTARDNDLFYGTAWADGRIRVHGPLTALDMDIDLTPRKNSELTILYETDNYNEVSGAIRFASKGEKPAEEPSETSSDYLNRVNVVVHANPDLDAQFVIDKQLGDAIRGHGKGTLRMLYDEQEQFFLYGSLELQDGEYVFSIPGINVLTKRVTLDPGGSIVWTGDPYNADIQMVGHYEKKISPVALLTGTPSASAVAPTRIVSVLKLSGSLIRPTIEFDILAPDLASSATASANEANAVIQRIRSDKDETMRQAVALLLFGNFIPPSFLSGNSLETNMLSGAGVAGKSVSTIASSVVNDLFAKYGDPTRIQVNIDDVRNASGNSNTQVFVNSEWFLSDRLRLDLNFDPTVSMLVNNLAVPFNFNLEYMTRNEDWKLKAFSRSSNLLLDQSGSGSIGNGVSGNTLGAGAIYRREFHTFRSR